MVAPTQTSTYTVEILNGECSITDTIMVEVLPAPTADAGDDQSFCDSIGGNFQLNALFNSNYSYFWEPNHLLSDFLIHNPIIISNQSSVFTLTVRDNETGCASIDQVIIDFEETPDLVVSEDVTICAGESASLRANGAIQYSWSPSSSLNVADSINVTANPISTTTYYVTGNSGECSSTDSVTVFVEGFLKFTEETRYYCEGDTIFIDGEIYFKNDTVPLTNPSLVDGCDSTHTIILNFVPLFSQIDTTICEGESIIINGEEFFESDSRLDTIINGTDSCFTEIEINLRFFPPTTNVPDTFSYAILRGDSVLIDDIPLGFSDYQWTPDSTLSCNNCPNPWATPFNDEIYTVNVFDENGCSVEIRGTVRVHETCGQENVIMPNIFSPNNDGRNDLFCRIGDGIEDLTSIRIFNRWGQKVFEDSGPNAKWDGTYNGKPQPAGVYVYMIEADCGAGPEKKIGDVTLVR